MGRRCRSPSIIFAQNQVNTLIRTALRERDTVTESRIKLADESLELCPRHLAYVALVEHAVVVNLRSG
jgi:hypothetical protein